MTITQKLSINHKNFKKMARLKGLLKIEGTLDNLTFYKTQDGYLVKTKSSVSGNRIANDANFQRTRENGNEFGNAASAGKLLRNTVRDLMMNASDNRVSSRLMQMMLQIKNCDIISARGDRNVGVGITYPEGQALLKGFDFNDGATLSSVLFAPFTVNTLTGGIAFAAFTPGNAVYSPTGATHVSFKSAFANVDFAKNSSSIECSPVHNLAINGTSTSFELIPATVPTGAGTKLYFLNIEFFQEINSIQYPLKNGAYNVLNVVNC